MTVPARASGPPTTTSVQNSIVFGLPAAASLQRFPNRVSLSRTGVDGAEALHEECNSEAKGVFLRREDSGGRHAAVTTVLRRQSQGQNCSISSVSQIIMGSQDDSTLSNVQRKKEPRRHVLTGKPTDPTLRRMTQQSAAPPGTKVNH